MTIKRYRLWSPRRPVLCVLLFFALVADGKAEHLSREVLDGPVTVDVIRVIDGDTIVVRAHPWLGLFVETRVRLEGIDAPELRGHCDSEKALAEQARTRLAELLATGPARLGEIRNDKYGGRVRARVFNQAGTDLGAALIAAGLARPYHGERRRPWCPANNG
ncbi:MAG: thermonuclease family protein [Rhodospirillaceae bacterium]